VIHKYTPLLGRDLFLRHGTSDDAMWIHTFEWGYSDPPAMAPPRTVLDLGANVGLTAALYQHYWPDAHVIAVEMDANNVQVARLNFSGQVIRKAVTFDREGPCMYDGDTLAASYALDPEGRHRTECIRLSSLLTIFEGEDVDFCKMDIEGTEWELLENGRWWSPFIRNLLVELHGDQRKVIMHGTRLLDALGYTVTPHPNHDRTLWATR
jgi:FkbM family methyltransferase